MLKKIKYPKLILLCICIIAAYFLAKTGVIYNLSHVLIGKGYIAAFLAGIMYAYGFAAPVGVAVLLSIADDVNIFIAACVGGIGSLISDLFIFNLIRESFADEFDKIKTTKSFNKIHELFKKHVSEKLEKYILWLFAGILIASPLPDEIGVSLISGFTKMKKTNFSIISFVLNTLGILVVLAIA